MTLTTQIATLLLLAALAAPAALDLVETSAEIDRLIRDGKFKKAEVLARQCLEVAPEELGFLSKLDMALNGQDRTAEADEVRARIRDLWMRRYRDNWIARGSPAGESAWARMIFEARLYHVYLTEYYEPQELEIDGVAVRVPYKIVASPKGKGGGGRVFKLEPRQNSAGTEVYSLREVLQAVHKLAVHYGSEEPPVRQVVADTLEFLNEGW